MGHPKSHERTWTEVHFTTQHKTLQAITGYPTRHKYERHPFASSIFWMLRVICIIAANQCPCEHQQTKRMANRNTQKAMDKQMSIHNASCKIISNKLKIHEDIIWLRLTVEQMEAKSLRNLYEAIAPYPPRQGLHVSHLLFGGASVSADKHLAIQSRQKTHITCFQSVNPQDETCSMLFFHVQGIYHYRW